MVYRGWVRNGKIEIDNGAAPLPEGAEVDITIKETCDTPNAESPPSTYEQLKDIIGSVPDLPEDLSVNHDHYLYGTAKRQ